MKLIKRSKSVENSNEYGYHLIFDKIRCVCAIRLTVIRIQRYTVSRNDASLAHRFGAHSYAIHTRIS